MLETRFVKNVSDFVAIWCDIQSLRERCGAMDDVHLDPLHFITGTSSSRPSCSVACLRGGKLVGLVYATEHRVWGFRTGYAIGGDFSGRGLVLCLPEDEVEVLEAAAACIFRNGIHSLHLRQQPRSTQLPHFAGLATKHLSEIIPGDRLVLGTDYEAFLSGLGKHTRRNIRNYRRKTFEAGIVFDAELSEEEFLRERARLNGQTSYAKDKVHLDRDDRLMALHSGGRRLALRDAGGKVIALVCGFSQGSRFHMLTQWNDPEHERLSLSLVLRGCAIEFLIGQGQTELVFMGGSSLSFGRFCIPAPYRSILLDRPVGLTGMTKRLMAVYCSRRAREEKPPPVGLEMLVGGFLDDRLLSRRTAVYVAEIAFQAKSHSEQFA